MRLLIITQKVDARDQLLGFFIDWIKRFSEKFEKITVLCLEKGEFSLPENVEVISLGKERDNSQFSIFSDPLSRIENPRLQSNRDDFQSISNVIIFKKIKYLFKFYKHIWHKRKDYNMVFVHMNPIWVVLGGPPWRLLRKKVYFWYTSGGVTFKLKIAEKFADKIFTASKESFRLLSKKVIVTGHGIDTELFKPDLSRLNLKEEALRLNLGEGSNLIKILSIGRIAPVKNYETLINAAKILKNRRVDFSVTMIGEAPLEKDKKYGESLKFKIRGLKLDENFNFIGRINHRNLPQYYQSHDIFIHLSKTGSLDKTLLEAMACGIKVLSSNDSSRTFLPQELMFNENSFVELAEKILLVSQQPSRQELRRYVVENHNLNNLTNKISEIIKS